MLDDHRACAGDLDPVAGQCAVVVRIKRDGHLVLAKGKGADMVPGAINTPELDPVHIDMGVTMPLDILQPSRFGVEGEVGGDDIEIPAAPGSR